VNRSSRDEPTLRIAMLSLHSSPLTQAGVGDSGGMNVYVRELVSSLAQAGMHTDVYVRRWDSDLADEVLVEPGFRVVHVDAGPQHLAKEALAGVVDEFREGVRADIDRQGLPDVIHANYWLSGVVGHQLKHELEIPLVSTFHTLARVKADTGDAEPQRRIDAEAGVIGCSDVIIANAEAEAEQLVELYGADRDRIEIVPPGVVHAFFSPGDRDGARRALGRDPKRPLLLFVGRIQPLKGVDIAIRALAEMQSRDAELVIVGGASGSEGPTEMARVRSLVDVLGLSSRVSFVEPQPHHRLSTYYRAADVCLMPSRSESFGLVALEAAACGIPVVAADVGGLSTLVRDGETGFLVGDRDPAAYAVLVDALLDDPAAATELAAHAFERSLDYTWSSTAQGLGRIYREVAARAPLECQPVA
jgi:D-inositol-3-phosphate glycosyltransferase